MAQLKDSMVTGNLRVTDTIYTDTVQVDTIKTHTASDTSAVGPGTDGQILKTNGTSSYWGNVNLDDVADGSTRKLSNYAPIDSPELTGTPTAPTATAGTNNTQIATTEFVNNAVNTAAGSVYRVKGTKADYASLPSSGNIAGDVWNVASAYGNYPAGTNWVWTGNEWDALGGEIDLSSKQDVLTFDTIPTENSTNPVTSGGLYTVITENEEVTSEALNDLNSRINNLSSKYLPLSGGNMEFQSRIKMGPDTGGSAELNGSGINIHGGHAFFEFNQLQITDGNDEEEGGLRLGRSSLQAFYNNKNFDFPTTAGTLALTSDIPSTYAGSPTAGGFANKAVAIPFGTVDAGSTATEITATVDNFPETLTDGVCAYIRNNVISSASGWTLNINGTGEKPVYNTIADATRVTTVFNNNSTYLFVYNSSRVEGGCWDIYYGYNANDNTVGYILRTNSMSLPTTSACYRYRLLFTSADKKHFVPANSSSSTNATAKRTTTQTPIDPFGSIRYYGSTSALSSGASPGATVLWEQYSVTLGYSFNRKGAALTLTAHEPVYIKCAPQADGSAIIDDEDPYVQELPTTADGKIYIYLGVTTSATVVEMTYYHPVYYYDGTRISVWPGPIIGDIQTALDAIIGKSLIEFKVSRNTAPESYDVYQAEEDMTWEDWINSAYNTDNYTIFTGADTLKYISKGGTGQAIMYGQDFVRPGDTIIDDGVYYPYGGLIED